MTVLLLSKKGKESPRNTIIGKNKKQVVLRAPNKCAWIYVGDATKKLVTQSLSTSKINVVKLHMLSVQNFR